MNDEKQLGGKIGDDHKKKVLDAVKEAQDWMYESGSTATKEDIEEKKSELEAIVNPITAKLYGDSKGSGGSDEQEEQVPDHDEL